MLLDDTKHAVYYITTNFFTVQIDIIIIKLGAKINMFTITVSPNY